MVVSLKIRTNERQSVREWKTGTSTGHIIDFIIIANHSRGKISVINPRVRSFLVQPNAAAAAVVRCSR